MLDENIVNQVEKDLLAEIVKNLETNNITDVQAQKQAQEFLALLPFEDKRDLLDKLFKLTQSNREVIDVYLKYASSIEEEEKHRKLSQMSEHIKSGKIDEALKVAKGPASSS